MADRLFHSVLSDLFFFLRFALQQSALRDMRPLTSRLSTYLGHHSHRHYLSIPRWRAFRCLCLGSFSRALVFFLLSLSLRVRCAVRNTRFPCVRTSLSPFLTHGPFFILPYCISPAPPNNQYGDLVPDAAAWAVRKFSSASYLTLYSPYGAPPCFANVPS